MKARLDHLTARPSGRASRGMFPRLARFLLAAALGGAPLAACHAEHHSTFVKVDDVALGRVVVYRNGVAFYERRATVEGGLLTVSVPRDRVDDFLKSLTVVDAITKQPLPVSIPREQANDGPYLVMKLQLPSKARADVVLTYVTESPAWKPSYRVVVGEHGKVMLEGWAIVDNTSGEDWKGVLVGVGSSSALSFHYDLWSVRQVQRETLQDTERFAIAPPTGVSPYGGSVAEQPAEVALAELDDGEIRKPEGHPGDAATKRVAMKDDEDAEDPAMSRPQSVAPAPMPVMESTGSYGGGVATDSYDGGPGRSSSSRRPKKSKAPQRVAAIEEQTAQRDARVATGDEKMRTIATQLAKSNQMIVVNGYADPSTGGDANRRATDRANIVRNQLIDQGVPPARIKVVAHTESGQGERVKLVAQAVSPEEQKAEAAGHQTADLAAEPVGESHFASPTPMTVEKGASAMVSMIRQETDGEVVYLYDGEGERGNANFAFRAVRFLNPTTSTLETGPVTVYGSERFIGEGLTESIPPKASAVVPYALDRQIVVEREDDETDKLASLVTLQRGILTAQVQHLRTKTLTVTNRLREPAKVYIKHTLGKGWKLVESPAQFERVGDAALFEVTLAANETRKVVISESTPIERTLDLSADVTLEMMRVYVDAPEGMPGVKEQLKKLLVIHKSLVDLAEEQQSMRRRLGDYRERMDELHGQILTLQAVKTGGDLMTHLKSKMKDISERVQKATIALVDQEEKIMLGRVQFQDALAELTLPDATMPVASK